MAHQAAKAALAAWRRENVYPWSMLHGREKMKELALDTIRAMPFFKPATRKHHDHVR